MIDLKKDINSLVNIIDGLIKINALLIDIMDLNNIDVDEIKERFKGTVQDHVDLKKRYFQMGLIDVIIKED